MRNHVIIAPSSVEFNNFKIGNDVSSHYNLLLFKMKARLSIGFAAYCI